MQGYTSSHRLARVTLLLEAVVIVVLLNWLSREREANPYLGSWLSQNLPVLLPILNGPMVITITGAFLGGIVYLVGSEWKSQAEKPSSYRPLSLELEMDRPLIPSGTRSRDTLRRLLSYVRREWPYAVAVGITIVATTALDLVQPWILGFLLIGDVILQKNLGMLPLVITLLAGAYLAKEVASYFQQYFTETLGQKTTHALRFDLYRSLERLPMRFFDNNRSGELVSRVISDTEEVDNVLSTGVSSLAANFVTVMSIFLLLFYVNSRLALAVVPVVVALAVAVNLFKKTIKVSARRIRQTVGDLAARVEETIGGIRIVKSFSMERHEAHKFQTQSVGILRSKVKLAKLSQMYSSTTALMAGLAVLLVIGIGAPSVVAGTLALGALFAFLGYVDKLFKPIVSISQANFNFQKAIAAGERIFEIIDHEPEADDAPDAFDPTSIKGHIEFDHVTFSYEQNREVLNDFSIDILPCEKVAIVGRSGVGKSTLVSLLLRFYQPTSGRIMIDGHPIDTWKLDSLRQKISVVLQEPILFSGSIRDNIAYGKPSAADTEIEEAARASNADDFITSLPEGYGTQIGERGVKLSSGQRQRIAIARALIKNPSILILDEATSNVDSESEALIQQALKHLAKNRTTIIIAHRLSTIMDADRIVVLDEDGVAEIGTHEQLLAREGVYSRLYEAQLKPQLIKPLHAT